MEERITRLEDQSIAYGLTLSRLINAAWDQAGRKLQREICCAVIESEYSQKLAAGGHERLQAILHEIEELFRAGGADD